MGLTLVFVADKLANYVHQACVLCEQLLKHWCEVPTYAKGHHPWLESLQCTIVPSRKPTISCTLATYWTNFFIQPMSHCSFLEPIQWVPLSQSTSEQDISTHTTILASQSPNINVTQHYCTISFHHHMSVFWEITPDQCHNFGSFLDDAKLASPGKTTHTPVHVHCPSMLSAYLRLGCPLPCQSKCVCMPMIRLPSWAQTSLSYHPKQVGIISSGHSFSHNHSYTHIAIMNDPNAMQLTLL